MPTAPTDDTQDYDPLVLADQDEETEEGEDGAAIPVPPPDEPPVADLTPELEAEIHKVILPEEPPPKAKQMVPQHIIDEELTADDLMDKGSL